MALLKQANMGLMNTNAQEHMQAQPCLFHWSWFGRVDIQTCHMENCRLPMTMTNDVVCSHEEHRKSKLMFELYVLHLPNMCRHRQIKQSAFDLASSLFLTCCLWHFVCTCLIQKEGIYIISEKLYYWQVKVKHLALRNTPPPIQTSLWDQQHLWMSFAPEPFPPTWSPENPGASMYPWGIPALYWACK